MVGPISQEDRETFTTKLKLGCTVLVGISAGLITLQGDPSIEIVLGAVAGGLLVGGPLIWYVFPETSKMNPAENRGRRRP